MMGQAVRMRWATLLEASHRTAINLAVDTKIVKTSVMLMYVTLQHSTDAACVPEEALGDIVCANIATHKVVYHCTWYEHEQLTA